MSITVEAEVKTTPRQKVLGLIEGCQRLVAEAKIEGAASLRTINLKLAEFFQELAKGRPSLEILPNFTISGICFSTWQDQPTAGRVQFLLNKRLWVDSDELPLELFFRQVSCFKSIDKIYELIYKMKPAAVDQFLGWVDTEVSRLTQNASNQCDLGFAKIYDSYYASTVNPDQSEVYAIYRFSTMAGNVPTPLTVGRYSAERLRAELDGGQLCSIEVIDNGEIVNYASCTIIPA